MSKPSTVPVLIATGTNFTSGPYSGSPTKVAPPATGDGYVPGTVITAEHHNYVAHWSSAWLSWVDEGTHLADMSAHIVETNSVGKTWLVAAQIGGETSGNTPLIVDQNLGVLPGEGLERPTLDVQDSAASTAVQCTRIRSRSPSTALRVEANGTGPAVYVAQGGSAPFGVGIAQDGASGGPAVLIVQDSAPVAGALRMDGCTNDPSGAEQGDLWTLASPGLYDLSFQTKQPGDPDDAPSRVWATRAGAQKIQGKYAAGVLGGGVTFYDGVNYVAGHYIESSIFSVSTRYASAASPSTLIVYWEANIDTSSLGANTMFSAFIRDVGAGVIMDGCTIAGVASIPPVQGMVRLSGCIALRFTTTLTKQLQIVAIGNNTSFETDAALIPRLVVTGGYEIEAGAL